MSLERINPGDLATPETYTHVIVASGRSRPSAATWTFISSAASSRWVFIAGQVAEDAQGNLVGPGDLAVQARQAFENVGRALTAAGARPEQVAKITIFVVDYRDEALSMIEEARAALFGEHRPVDALIGVKTLAHPGGLIEIEAIAVLDDP